MKTPTTPRCPELPGHVHASMSKPGAFAFVKVNDEGHEVFFMPVLRYKDEHGVHVSSLVDDVEDFPDFSTDGSGERQCFVRGYANIEDALLVVRALNQAHEN